MRRLMVILTLLSLLASYFAVTVVPVSAAVDQVCWQGTETWNNPTSLPDALTLTLYNGGGLAPFYSTTATLSAGATQTVSVHGFFAPGTVVALYETEFGLTSIGGSQFNPVSASVCNAPSSGMTDGRLNAFDVGAPLSAYCRNGGVAVYDIDGTGHGTLAFIATQEQTLSALTKASESGENVLVAQGEGDSLYALSSNQLTLAGPDLGDPSKLYEYMMAADVCW